MFSTRRAVFGVLVPAAVLTTGCLVFDSNGKQFACDRSSGQNCPQADGGFRDGGNLNGDAGNLDGGDAGDATALVFGLGVTGSGGCVTVRYQLRTASSAQADVRIEFDPAGQGAFQAATAASGSEGLSQLATSPAGAVHTFLWNSSADLPWRTLAGLRLRVSATAASVSSVGAQTVGVGLTNGLAFDGGTTFAVGASPSWAAVGDFDRDGNPDVVISDSNTDLTFLRGRGDGTFEKSTLAATKPWAIATGDINGDGKLDLVYGSNAGSPTSLLVRLGNGDGTFQPELSVNNPSGSVLAIVLADLNGDGKLDAACASSGPTTVFYGNGDGTFQNAQTYAEAGVQPGGIVAADFNHDGRLDLAVTSSGNDLLSIHLGVPGGFGASVPYQAASVPGGLDVGDFNRDGNLDIVVAEWGSSRLAVYPGMADGGFGNPVFTPVPAGTQALVRDFDGDGKLDVAVMSVGGLLVMKGNGDGSFQAGVALPGTPSSLAVVTGDFNRDGRLDLLELDRDGNSATLFLSEQSPRCEASFAPAASPSVGTHPNSLRLADFDQDGRWDLITANMTSSNLTLCLGNGDGTFQAARTIPVPNSAPAVALPVDLNADGRPDLVVADAYGDIEVLMGLGSAFFADPTRTSYPAFLNGQDAEVCDVNADGKPDLLVGEYQNLRIGVMLGNGDGSFAPPVAYAVAAPPASVRCADMNGDGKVDIVSGGFTGTGPYVGYVSVLLGRGDGTFAPATSIQVGMGSWALALADMNRDGRMDVLSADASTGGPVSLLLGNGDGTLRAPTSFGSASSQLWRMTTADLLGNGRPDVVATGAGTYVALGSGSRAGVFVPVSTATGMTDVVAEDLNRDGIPDLIGASSTTDDVMVLLGK